MARMSIDDAALRDTRIAKLGRVYGWNEYEALGRLMHVWTVCYDRISPLLTAEDIDLAGDKDGLSTTLVAVGLAERVRDRFRIRGASGRIEYLQEQRRRASNGGKQRSENNKGSASSGNGAAAQAGAEQRLKPLTAIATATASAPVSASAPAPAGVKQKRRSPKARSGADRQRVIDCFHQAYLHAYGAKPTWDDVRCSQVDVLLTKHPADELCRRIGNLFASKGGWLKPPFDLKTLVAHIDKLVQPVRDDRSSFVSDALDELEELKRAEEAQKALAL